MIGVYDGVGDYSEGHVYLKDTGEERRYVASVIRDLGIAALPGGSSTSRLPGTKETRDLVLGHTEVWHRVASLALCGCCHWRSHQVRGARAPVGWGSRSVQEQCHPKERFLSSKQRARDLTECRRGKEMFIAAFKPFFPHGAAWKAFYWDAWWARAVTVRK